MRRSAPALALAAVLTAAGLAAGASCARAQSNPSSDQIINALRPGAGMGGLTRGIRPAAPAEPSAPPPAAVAPAAAGSHAAVGAAPRRSHAAARVPAAPVVASVGGAPSVNLHVEFATNSAELTPAAMRTLDELGRALSSQDLAAYRFRIEGHTDTVGSHDANQALSERRAAAVVDYLSRKFGVDRARLDAVGLGEDGLAVPTPGQTPEPRNRRVQVVNIGA